MFGRRPDGRRLDHIDPIVQFMPYVMTARNDAMNLISDEVDYQPLADYIKKRTREGRKVSFMALVVAAYVRAVAEYPALNRFIINSQVFARNEITVSLTVTRSATDKTNLDEALIKMKFQPDATLDEVNEQMERLIADATNENADNGTTDFAAKVIKHRLLVKAVVKVARLLDRYGLMPKFLHEISPFHCSMFITNMASIGLPSIFHHLYNFGNVSVFIAMGGVQRKTVMTPQGPVTKPVLPLGITTDERICGGMSYALGFNHFKKMLAHPEQLEVRPDHVNSDFDFEKKK